MFQTHCARLGHVVAATLLVAGLVLTFVSASRGQQSSVRKSVLVLYWYNKDYPWNVKFDQSFQAALHSAQAGTIDYYPEYLETNRFPGENQSVLLHDYLRQKYADRAIDVVVANSDACLEFLQKYRG